MKQFQNFKYFFICFNIELNFPHFQLGLPRSVLQHQAIFFFVIKWRLEALTARDSQHPACRINFANPVRDDDDGADDDDGRTWRQQDRRIRGVGIKTETGQQQQNQWPCRLILYGYNSCFWQQQASFVVPQSVGPEHTHSHSPSPFPNRRPDPDAHPIPKECQINTQCAS